MAHNPTVFVVDDDPGALRSTCWLIEQADLPVRAFQSGREFLESCSAQDCGCLVLDVRMPDMGGLEVQQRLAQHGIELPVIFLTGHGDVPTCAKAFKGGALEFLEKPVNDVLLLEHIRRAIAQSTEEQSQREFGTRVSQLTPSEREVFDLLVAGKTLKEIAIIRKVAVQTIWKHRFSILHKMGVETDRQLVYAAAQWVGRRRA